MKNFEIKCTYTQEHDTTESFIRQVVELILHLNWHKWVATNGWEMTEYIDADGDLCMNLTFTFTSSSKEWNGKEITHFLDLCAQICTGDSVRIYGGGSTDEQQEV